MNQQDVTRDCRSITAMYAVIALLLYLICSFAGIDADSIRFYSILGVFASVLSFTLHIASRAYLNVEALTWGS